MQGNSRKHTQNACGLQCIPVCILNLGYLPAPDQISSVIVARLACTQSVNPDLCSANRGLDGPTCENQAANIPRSREFSNKFGIKKRFLCTLTNRTSSQCRGHSPSRRLPLRQMKSRRYAMRQKIKFNHRSLTDANCIISMHNISSPA